MRDTFIAALWAHYAVEKKEDLDTIRSKPRVEIPAAFLLAGLTFGIENPALLTSLRDLVLSKQHRDGYWEEYSYEPQEEEVGYYGAVPTCFAILALLKAGQTEAAVRGCDFLYSQESNGYFRKATINKTDVLNTNLLSAVTLLCASRTLHPDSRRKPLYEAAARRALIHAQGSQLWSGALPYSVHGFQVPFLYHLMSLALLEIGRAFYPRSASLQACIVKARRFFDSLWDEKTLKIKWQCEKHPEKSGASWAYGWAYACLCARGRSVSLEALFLPLQTETYLKNELPSPPQADLFYTAWTLLALSLAHQQHFPSLTHHKSLLLFGRQTIQYVLRTPYIIRYAVNRYVYKNLDCLDKGPVEYW